MMKLEISSSDLVKIDARTQPPRGNSAVNQHVDDPDTEVYYGGLHASVTMRDLHVEVLMDPTPGQWNDAAWAREQAWRALVDNLTPEAWKKVTQAFYAAGASHGSYEAKQKIRRALGLQDRGPERQGVP